MPTESQLRDNELRLRILQRIEDGRLPVMLPRHIAAGYGAGNVCAACDQPVTATQVEYEVQAGDPLLRFHLGCYVLWQIECQRKLQGPALDCLSLRAAN